MKYKFVLPLFLIVLLIGSSQSVSFAEGFSEYMVFKYGTYSPSAEYDINNVNVDIRSGFDAEIAVGHYYNPMFALELGSGYFEGKGSPAAQPGEIKLKVVPILLTAKAFLPMGPIIEPYGAFGIGYYITKLKGSGFGPSFSDDREDVVGLHAGAGLNINIAPDLFLGVEGRYIWAEPEFGGEDIKIDGFIVTADLGFRF